MATVVWVLDVAQVVILVGVVAGNVAVVDGDVVAERRGSGLERGGWGVTRGAVDWFGIVCRHFRGVWGGFWAGGELVVVVNDGVVVVGHSADVVDGGCAGVVDGDVAASRVVLGCMLRVWVAISVVLGVTWVLKLTVEVVVVWVPAFSRCCGGSL